jgi:glycosyltransferase involved in cell wall biosynthesis
MSQSPALTATGPRLRVVHLVETLELGGMERAIATLCLATDHTRFDVSVVAMKRLGPVAAELLAAGIPVECANVPSSPPDYFAWRHVVPVLRRLRPDIVHTHNSAALIYGAPSARWCGVSTIIHTDHGRAFPDRKHVMVAERIASALVWRVVAVSAPLARDLGEHVGIASARLRVVPNGVADLPPANEDAVHGLRRDWLRGATGPLVGLGARLVWEKGLDDLLHAWRLVSAAIPDARLVIAGDGPERVALEGLTTELGLATSVQFAGTVTDMPSLYRALDVFVLPSVSEGLPLALLEAMAASLPIVATRVGGIPSVLESAGAGELVPSRAHELLAEALLRVLGSLRAGDGMATALGQRARQAYLASGTSAVMARRYERLYLREADADLR